jgi:methylated-DNA-[protein]-cysteine S-methyltransferase
MVLFETAIGRCGIVWGGDGLVAISLPHSRDERTREQLRRRAPAANERTPPAPVREAIDRIFALLDGEPSDLDGIALDLGGVEPFDRRVAVAARSVGPGQTVTYGELAARIGAAGEAREVGAALGRNRFPLVVPCHRVVAADGGLGGFSAPGGTETKRMLLAIERRHGDGPLTLFDG